MDTLGIIIESILGAAFLTPSGDRCYHGQWRSCRVWLAGQAARSGCVLCEGGSKQVYGHLVQPPSPLQLPRCHERSVRLMLFSVLLLLGTSILLVYLSYHIQYMHYIMCTKHVACNFSYLPSDTFGRSQLCARCFGNVNMIINMVCVLCTCT